jgi:O-antigen ligase
MKIISLCEPNFQFLKILSILCACVVPLLVTGPFLPDLLLSLLSLWFLYYLVKKKTYRVFRNSYFYFFIGFWLVCIFSSLLSEQILFSLKSSLPYIRIAIFALLISYLIDNHKEILNYFYYALVISFFILILDGYLQYFTGFNILNYPMFTSRVSSFFKDKLILGSYLVRLFPLLFALFIIKEKKSSLENYGMFVLFILIDVLIFLSGERASFLFLNLSSFFIIIFISKYKLARTLILVCAYCIILFLSIYNKQYYDRYITSVNDAISSEQSNRRINIFSPAHDSFARTAWNMFLDKPILGHGPNSFRIKCNNPLYAEGSTPCNTHPHNFYIQLLAETGIIGFLFLAGLFFYFIYLMIKFIFQYFIHKKKLLSDYQICLLAGLLITIWPITTNGNIFNNHLMIMYGLQMGFFRKDI